MLALPLQGGWSWRNPSLVSLHLSQKLGRTIQFVDDSSVPLALLDLIGAFLVVNKMKVVEWRKRCRNAVFQVPRDCPENSPSRLLLSSLRKRAGSDVIISLASSFKVHYRSPVTLFKYDDSSGSTTSLV